jgi:pimeloyl-ACP methyl ester carboxylesterase
MEQTIRFLTADDGAKLAYASSGSGPALLKTANWLNHLEYDWQSPVWRSWRERLGRTPTLVRYDERGCGLSDWDVDEFSVERWVADLEAVVDAAGVERFTILGMSQGAAVGIAYAARHPERVERMVLYGGYAQGRNHRGDRALAEALEAAIRAGWDNPNPAFRRLFTVRFLPEGTPEQMAWYDELQRRTTSTENAARM